MTEVSTQKPIVAECNGQFDESAYSNGKFFYDDEGTYTVYETEYDIQSSEDACTNDDDEDFLVNEENEIVEPDVDVHLFDMDGINADGFDSNPGNDDEINYRRRREAKDIVYLHSIESIRNLKLYKNDSVRIRARCDGKVLVFTMSQVKAVQDQLQRDLKVQISMSKAFRAKAKAEREIRGDHGIVPSIKPVYSSVEHRYCSRYIHENIKQGWCGQAYKDLLWRAASATNVKDFKKCRAKSDLLLNNICEAMKLTGIPCKHVVAGGNNAEASSSASRQAQQTEPTVGQYGSGGGVVIGLSVGQGGACGAGGPGGTGVANQDITDSSPPSRVSANLRS
nr:hypothetical protein [Tanacetum cinerariifolium]